MQHKKDKLVCNSMRKVIRFKLFLIVNFSRDHSSSKPPAVERFDSHLCLCVHVGVDVCMCVCVCVGTISEECSERVGSTHRLLPRS